MATEPTTGVRTYDAEALAQLYRDLHTHPELSFAETRTSGILAERLTELGYAVTTGVGRTGVVGVLRRGEGPTVYLRADMDGLPVDEQTGLEYASVERGTDPDGNDVPVMHACGHDVHVTCLVGAAAELAGRDDWAGTLVLVGQPAEEVGAGARAMLDDGLYDLAGSPDVVLGQHVAPTPAGTLAMHAGPAFAAYDAMRVRLYGKGGHGSRPEACVDPILMAAAIVLRLQGIVAREIGGAETAVVTVGTLHAGTKVNIIPDTAELEISVRTFDPHLRDRVLAAIERIINAEAAASGAPRPPDIEALEAFPVLTNDPDGCERTRPVLGEVVNGLIFESGPVTGSEDVGLLATDAGVPCVYWLLGGADPAQFAGVADVEGMLRVMAEIPSNHSPKFAPVIEPTLSVGVSALVAAARCWLAPAS